jgi:hypothetical protein
VRCGKALAGDPHVNGPKEERFVSNEMNHVTESVSRLQNSLSDPLFDGSGQ